MKKFFLKLFIFLLSICVMVLLFANAFLFSILIKAKKIDIQTIYPIENTRIYDENNQLILELGCKASDWISYEEISPNMIHAIISIEDERFFEHHGIDQKRIISSMMNNILEGKLNQGASTISQQLIKNQYLSNEKTLKRKITEMYLAMKLESKYTKEEILESYLNQILFGKRLYGIQAASQYYFQKNASDLLIEEAALLAGMIQMPNFYDPEKNFQQCMERKNLVLKKMYELGYINSKDYIHSKNKEIQIISHLDEENTVIYYNALLDCIENELQKHYSYNLSDGIEIYTSIDSPLTEYIYKIGQNKNGYFQDNLQKLSIVIIDSSTGELKAILGSRDPIFSGLNYAYKIPLQPGSTIKPILDYAPFIETFHASSATILPDIPTNYSSGQEIHNWDYQYKGPITLRKALKESRNIPAYFTYMTVGMKKAHEFMNGFNLFSNDILEANCIGGFTNGFTVYEMTNAYQAFANNGLWIESLVIRSVNYQDKTIQYLPRKKRAVTKETAYIISDILKDVIQYSQIEIPNQYLMGKTGQTNYDIKTKQKYNIPDTATKDSWMIAYTLDYTVGVWTGYDIISENTYLNSQKKNISKNVLCDIFYYLPPCYRKYSIPNSLLIQNVEIVNDELYLSKENTGKDELFFKDNFIHLDKSPYEKG